MNEMNMLVSWIGGADLRAMATALDNENVRARVDEATRKSGASDKEGVGPVKTLLCQRKFTEVHLLSQWPTGLNQLFANWLPQKPRIHEVDQSRLSNPIDYQQVYEVSNATLEKIYKKSFQLSILLSPGTPTMAAVWLLLGKTRFPANFLQAHNGKVIESVIPFDIMVDVLPELLRNPDSQLQQLALSRPGDVKGFEEILGGSMALKVAVDRAKRVAIRDVAILLTGESGTGKEMFARAIHRASHRGRDDNWFEKFEAFNCAAIPESLFESELFGVEEGAYTGARKTRKGAFERANGGTLFLDEIGELSSDHQAKLLRALQPPPDGGPCQRMIRHVGGKHNISCDVRIIAATNRNLLEAVNNRQFRDDLFYRLAPIQIQLPSLRDRRADIQSLAESHLARLNDNFKKTEPGYVAKNLQSGAIKRLRIYDWPGNVRELNNVLTQAAVFAVSTEIRGADIDSAIASFDRTTDAAVFSRSRGNEFDLTARLAEIERIFLLDAVKETDGNQTKAAKLLGISQQSLNKKLKKSSSRFSSVTE